MDYIDDGLERGDETPYMPAQVYKPHYRNAYLVNRDNWICDNLVELARWWRVCNDEVNRTGGPVAADLIGDFECFCVSQWEMERDRQQVAA